MTFRFDSVGSSPRILHSKSVLKFLPSLLLRSVWKLTTLLGHLVRFLCLSSRVQRIQKYGPIELRHIDLQLELGVETVSDTVGERVRLLVWTLLRTEPRAHQLVQSRADRVTEVVFGLGPSPQESFNETKTARSSRWKSRVQVFFRVQRLTCDFQ